MRRTFGILALRLGLGCAPPPPLERSCEGETSHQERSAGDLDLLFVIDTSPAMLDLEASLAANARRFIGVLESLRGGLPSLHIGVVTADPADDGRLRNRPRGACEPPSGYFISDIGMWGGLRERNYTGTLADVFAFIADRGVGGGPVSTPLEAARAALDGRNPQNAGFLRRTAYRTVVLLTA